MFFLFCFVSRFVVFTLSLSLSFSTKERRIETTVRIMSNCSFFFREYYLVFIGLTQIYITLWRRSVVFFGGVFIVWSVWFGQPVGLIISWTIIDTWDLWLAVSVRVFLLCVENAVFWFAFVSESVFFLLSSPSISCVLGCVKSVLKQRREKNKRNGKDTKQTNLAKFLEKAGQSLLFAPAT